MKIPPRTIALLAILALALGLRAAHWAAVRSHPFFEHLAVDSQEYDRWAQEIAAGNRHGSEAFFQAPLYPYFLAGLYSVFGRDLDAVYWTQMVLAVLGCWALYRAGGKLGDAVLGLLAAALAAAYPVFLFYDVQLLKTSLAVTMVSFLLWALAVAWRRRDAAAWLAVGAACGLLSLLRENFLLVIPFFWLSTFAHGGRIGLRRSGGLICGLILVLLPVAIRNHQVSGSFLPTTFQGGVNFYIGNNPDADGTYRPLVPGKQIPFYERQEAVRLAEEARGRSLSPGEVSRYWLGRSLSWARQSPGDFLVLQLRKLRLFWSLYEWPDAVDYYYVKELSPVLRWLWLELGGLAILAAAGLWWLRRDLMRFVPLLLFVVAVTASTIAFFLFSRYRLPVVPGLMLLAALPLRALWLATRHRRWPQVASLGVLVVAAVAVPRLSSFEPRMDLVHFNLGRIAEEKGQPEVAITHYLTVLQYHPGDFSAIRNLGNLAARAERWEEALSWSRQAVALEPSSDDAHANLGGVLLRVDRLRLAQIEIERALELNPRNVFALHNGALLYDALGDRDTARRYRERLRAASPGHPQAAELSQPSGHRGGDRE